MAADEQITFISLRLCDLSRWRTLKKTLIRGRIAPALFVGNLYHEHVKHTSKVLKREDCLYQCSLSQKIEYHCGEQGGSGCQLPGEDDPTSQLLLSVTLSSQWCMDVIRHRSPSRTSQYHHAEECYSETMADCDPCYGMTKLHEGGGERNGA